MNIDEIALRVAEQIEQRGRTYSPDHYIDVVKLVLAELSKDAEPVAVIRNSHQIDFIGCKDLPARTELFTSPHNTVDIEQRVVEAFVMKFKRHVGGDGEFWLHELEGFCEDGKWREYL